MDKKRKKQGRSLCMKLTEAVAKKEEPSPRERPSNVLFDDWRKQQMERVEMKISNMPVDHSKLLTQDNGVRHDVQLVLGGKTLYAHRAILEIRCPNIFVTAVKKRQIKKAVVTIEIDEKSGVTFRSLENLVKYLYSATVQFFGKEMDEIVHIIHIAKLYEVHTLVKISQRFLYSCLNCSEFFRAYKESHRLHVEEGKVACRMFARRHFADLVVQKGGIYALGMDLFYEMVHYSNVKKPEELQEEEGFTSIDILAKQAADEIVSDFKTIYEDMSHADGSVKIGDDIVLFHTPILVGLSGEFSKLVKKSAPAPSVLPGIVSPASTTTGTSGSQPLGQIEIPEKYDIDAESFRAFLKYLYYGASHEVDPLVAQQLRPFAIDFGLGKLREICEQQIKHGISVDSVVSLYALAKQKQNLAKFRSIAKELAKACMQFIESNLQAIDFSNCTNSDAIVDILQALQFSAKRKNLRRVKTPRSPGDRFLRQKPSVDETTHEISPSNSHQALVSPESLSNVLGEGGDELPEDSDEDSDGSPQNSAKTDRTVKTQRSSEDGSESDGDNLDDVATTTSATSSIGKVVIRSSPKLRRAALQSGNESASSSPVPTRHAPSGTGISTSAKVGKIPTTAKYRDIVPPLIGLRNSSNVPENKTESKTNLLASVSTGILHEPHHAENNSTQQPSNSHQNTTLPSGSKSARLKKTYTVSSESTTKYNPSFLSTMANSPANTSTRSSGGGGRNLQAVRSQKKEKLGEFDPEEYANPVVIPKLTAKNLDGDGKKNSQPSTSHSSQGKPTPKPTELASTQFSNVGVNNHVTNNVAPTKVPVQSNIQGKTVIVGTSSGFKDSHGGYPGTDDDSFQSDSDEDGVEPDQPH